MKKIAVHKVVLCLLNGDLGLSKASCMDDHHNHEAFAFVYRNNER